MTEVPVCSTEQCSADRHEKNKLLEHQKISTHTSISLLNQLTFLSITMLNSSWKGTAYSFILYWMNQAYLYNKAVLRAKKLKEELLTIMLQNSVWPIDDLCKVKTNADHKVTKGGAELTYK